MTEPMKPSVTQADRDAAASLIDWMHGGSENSKNRLKFSPSGIRAGHHDDGVPVQDFARHREAPTRPPASDSTGAGDALNDLLQRVRATIVAHHDWHEAQTEPDPEHGYIPANEYAESQLFERTYAALGAIDAWLERDSRATLSQPSPDEGAGIDEEELLDLIGNAIGDSIDMDWSTSIGARAVVKALKVEGWTVVAKGATDAE